MSQDKVKVKPGGARLSGVGLGFLPLQSRLQSTPHLQELHHLRPPRPGWRHPAHLSGREEGDTGWIGDRGLHREQEALTFSWEVCAKHVPALHRAQHLSPFSDLGSERLANASVPSDSMT